MSEILIEPDGTEFPESPEPGVNRLSAASKGRPFIPETLADVDLPKALLIDLFLRRVNLDGQSTFRSLSGLLKLSIPVLEGIYGELRSQRLVEVKGMVGDDYLFTLTEAGRALANERFAICQYAGPAPVSLEEYRAVTVAQAVKLKLNRQRLREALSDLVVSDHLIEQLGPALVSQTSLFLYGPSGNGKTSVAERLVRTFSDDIVIPYGIEVDGHIILLHDPSVHHPVENTDPDLDPRWAVSKRPCIMVGGELVPSMLELHLDEASGVYAAPLQMKANNGILLVDDFGRQVMTPAELLNRWIVPLDRRVDFLRLRYGVKFQIPFELMVVFSTNLDPSQLVDKAFLRRMQNKVYIGPVTPEVFDEIFRRVVEKRGILCSAGSAEHLRKLCQACGEDLCACIPADICDIVAAIDAFEERPVRITKEQLERAVELYFAAGGPARQPSEQ